MNSKAEKSNPEKSKRERQDWLIVLLILLLGFACVLVAGQYALRFAPTWQADTNLDSNIDLNSQFLTGKPQQFFEPLDPAILTQPGWVSGNVFLTPGADFDTGTPLPPASSDTEVPTALGTTAVPTNTIAVTDTAVPTNTLVWLPLPNTPTRRPPPADTPTNTPLPTIDLEISMSDGGLGYTPGNVLMYTIVVTNNSAYDVAGATVTDAFGAQITGASWTCVPSVPTATCANGAGNPFSDVINLPAGSFVTYTVSASVSPLSVGPLANAATVITPAFETDPGDNTAMISTAGPSGGPGGQINIGPGNNLWDVIGPGGSVTMIVSPAITTNGNNSHDFVFYERLVVADPPPPVPSVDLDVVEIQISSDGSTWYSVFNWGSAPADSNTNVAGFCPGTEDDNCRIPSASLYNGTGITINIDGLVPPGSYPWIHIISPDSPPDTDGGAEIDSIQPYP